jgi:hypothetical protein
MGGPRIQFDTQRVMGVFTPLTKTIGEAVSTECVRMLLENRLQNRVSCLSIDLLKLLA